MLEICYDDDKIEKIERELRGFGRNSLPKVMSRGLNRTATEARTKTGRFLAAESGLKIKVIRKSITLRRATYRNWRSSIKISCRRIPLYNFSARQTKKGVTYKKGGEKKRILIRSAFVATMASGHTGVFKRKAAARLPISELRGPSMGQVFVGAQDKAAAICRESMGRLERNIHDQVRMILARRLPA